MMVMYGRGYGDDAPRDHQERACDGACHHGVDAGAAKQAGIQTGEVTARHAAEIGGQERQPGKHRK